MRVIHVVWTLDQLSGGLARAVVLIANAQAAAGMRVAVLTTTPADEPLDRAATALAPGVEALAFSRSVLTGRFAGSRGLRPWLARNLQDGDVVHAHAIWDLASASAAWVARRRGVPLVISPHGSLEPFDLQKKARAKRVLGPLFVRPSLAAATVHLTTRREADCLESYGAEVRACVLPLPAGGPALVGDGPAFRRRHRLPGDVPLLLFMGRVNYKKGLTHLVRALDQMRQPAHLVIAGTGEDDYEREVRRLAEELGVADRITWVGWLSAGAKADAFAAAAAFVLLSDAENYGISVVEAAQHGVLVVASGEVGVAADLAIAGAVVLSSREPGAAAACLDRVLVDPELRRDVLARAAEVADRDLDDEALGRRYAALGTGVRS